MQPWLIAGMHVNAGVAINGLICREVMESAGMVRSPVGIAWTSDRAGKVGPAFAKARMPAANAFSGFPAIPRVLMIFNASRLF